MADQYEQIGPLNNIPDAPIVPVPPVLPDVHAEVDAAAPEAPENSNSNAPLRDDGVNLDSGVEPVQKQSEPAPSKKELPAKKMAKKPEEPTVQKGFFGKIPKLAYVSGFVCIATCVMTFVFTVWAVTI